MKENTGVCSVVRTSTLKTELAIDLRAGNIVVLHEETGTIDGMVAQNIAFVFCISTNLTCSSN